MRFSRYRSAQEATLSISPTGLALATFLVVLAGCSLIVLPPLHPAQLWTIPWSIAVLLYSVRLLPYTSLSSTTVIIAAAATLAFVVFSLAGVRAADLLGRTSRHRRRERIPNYRTVCIAALAVVCITVVWAGAFLASASVNYGARDALTASSRVREELGNGALAFQIKYVYASLASVVLCCIAAGLALERRRRVLWLASASFCGASIYLATGRATVISALVVGVVAYLSSRGQPIQVVRFLVGIVAVVAIAVGIFVAGGQLIGKTYANSADLQAVESVFTRHSSLSTLALPYKYASAPVAALEIQTRSSTTWGDAGGCAALVELCKGLERLNVDVQPVSRIRPFTAPPLPWNTYTALDVPLIDGGKGLAVPIVALLGTLSGVLWAWSRSRTLIGILLYSLAAAAIVGSPAVFLFTAPHLVGAAFIGALAIYLASKSPERLLPRLRESRRSPDALPD
jgi:oligosaccharide repeat unit polymerase